jgi:hypothetical protein
VAALNDSDASARDLVDDLVSTGARWTRDAGRRIRTRREPLENAALVSDDRPAREARAQTGVESRTTGLASLIPRFHLRVTSLTDASGGAGGHHRFLRPRSPFALLSRRGFRSLSAKQIEQPATLPVDLCQTWIVEQEDLAQRAMEFLARLSEFVVRDRRIHPESRRDVADGQIVLKAQSQEFDAPQCRLSARACVCELEVSSLLHQPLRVCAVEDD